MTATPILLAEVGGRHQALAVTLFVVFVAATLAITVWAKRTTRTVADFYAGGREFFPAENGLAITGNYLSAASVLGIAGLIALNGYDGFLYSVGFLVAWLVVLMLTVELVRNCGRFTMADVLAFRLARRRVRIAGAVAAISVSIFYLLAQMVGAGSLIALVLGLHSPAAKNWTIVLVGALMIVYVTLGGMKATTWIQIVKAVLLLVTAGTLTFLVLLRFGFDLNELFRAAQQHSGRTENILAPGIQYGASVTSRIDFVSLALALVLGTAGLPHVLMRFYTVPTARAARRSVMWSIGLIGAFYLMTIVLGFGAAAVVGAQEIRASNAAGNTALPLLAQTLGGGPDSAGGTVLLAVVAAVVFGTILGVVAGLTLASSTSFAHDLYVHVICKGQVGEHETVRMARLATVGIGAVSIVLGIAAQKLNVAFLVGLAFAVAASANLPAILYTLFWRRFTMRGAEWSVYGGLVSAVVLVIFSPVVSGAPTSLFPGVDFALFPLQNPGIVSIPLGFLFGWLGTVLSEDADEEAYAEMEVRALTGAGAH